MCLNEKCECKCLGIVSIDEEHDDVYYEGIKCEVCSDEYPEVEE